MAPEEVAAICSSSRSRVKVDTSFRLPNSTANCGPSPRSTAFCLVADEVQSGMGRTGRMCAIEHWDVEPDILCLAKGIASGLPLGAIVARADVMDWPPGAHASTFGGNPVACAAALETIALMQEGLMENAARVGDFLHRQAEGDAGHASDCR